MSFDIDGLCRKEAIESDSPTEDLPPLLQYTDSDEAQIKSAASAALHCLETSNDNKDTHVDALLNAIDKMGKRKHRPFIALLLESGIKALNSYEGEREKLIIKALDLAEISSKSSRADHSGWINRADEIAADMFATIVIGYARSPLHQEQACAFLAPKNPNRLKYLLPRLKSFVSEPE